MDTIEFKNVIKVQRQKITRPNDLIYGTIDKLDIFNGTVVDFRENFSEYVELTRANAWENYLAEESKFRAACYGQLFASENINIKTPEELAGYVANYNDHIFELAKSDTNSRRSRSGKEFEAIVEYLLMGSRIFVDSQANIGKASFSTKGLGKLVDFVTPTSVHYEANKRKTLLISLKTTLRERWQEVVEEKNRTASQTMFLATMDTSITKDVVDRLDQNNVTLVVTRRNKVDNYQALRNIITFEEMVQEIINSQNSWKDDELTIEQLREVIVHFGKLRENNSEKPFVVEYANWAMDFFTKLTRIN